VRRSVWLAGIALAVLTAACGGGGPAAAAILGVWEGTLIPAETGHERALCLDVTQAAPDGENDAISFGGDLYLDGELAGLVGGVLGDDGLVTLGGTSELGVYSGTLDSDAVAGTWAQTSAAVAPTLGSWSAEKADRESCG
jgi:hypothetical protein